MSKISHIQHIDDMESYVPPAHSRTRNVRLVEASQAGAFEMVLGRVEPGGKADKHFHASNYQAMYVVGGRAEVILGDQPAEICGPGTIVRIPPNLAHEVISLGPEPLQVVLVYSPPLDRAP
ncbi:MAG: cupin domain-containing protein [Methyloligellaceae bacterium]